MKLFRHLAIVMVAFLCIPLIYATPESLLPKPQICEFKDNLFFKLNRSITLALPDGIEEKDPAIEKELTNLIVNNGGSISTSSHTKIVVELIKNIDNAEFQDEAYNINIKSSQITINATTLRGAYWAIQTLIQLAEGNNQCLNQCSITDWPAFRLRGYTHDIGRGFLEFDELKKHIVKLSRYKINTFHWHLTENQGWRIESKVYPQLVSDSSFTRLPGKYYTIAQAKELVTFAKQHGIDVIPEIDMPGHSLAFRKAMGHSMLTNEGLTEMKNIMTEACQTFADCEYIHIGTDELRKEDLGDMDWTVFVPQIVSLIRSHGKKVVSWNPGYNYSSDGIDMTQMWSSSGRPTTGVPTIDSRYHYANHFDNFADIVSLYKCTIAEQQKGSHQYAGVIISFWNDRYLPSGKAVITQNSFYPSMLAIAERAWIGGGNGYFNTIGVKLESTDVDFMNWEERFLFHKANFLKDEPMVYVKQSYMRWRITDAFPNNGDLDASFPPENGIAPNYTYNGVTYSTSDAIGGGIYLRHVWGAIVPAFYSNPQKNHTAYAYTYVYSPIQQQVGARIEFQNYSRSENDLAAPQNQWDYKKSRIWINDSEILPPVWQNTHTAKSSEVTLKNENLAARAPIPVTLNKGWNKVFMKLPVGEFTQNEVRLTKWMFCCVFTTLDGKDALSNLIYSPDKTFTPR